MSSHLKEKHFIVTVALATTKSVIQLKYIAPLLSNQNLTFEIWPFCHEWYNTFWLFWHVQGWVPLRHQNELVNWVWIVINDFLLRKILSFCFFCDCLLITYDCFFQNIKSYQRPGKVTNTGDGRSRKFSSLTTSGWTTGKETTVVWLHKNA